MSHFQSTVHSPDRDIHQLKDFSFHILQHSLQHSCPCILYQCRTVMNYAPKETVNYLTNQTQLSCHSLFIHVTFFKRFAGLIIGFFTGFLTGLF